MTKLILFRFHKEPDVCGQNLALLRKMNPDVQIHGMYGGFGGVASLPKELCAMMDSVWALPFEDPLYNWMNGDLCTRWWFKDFGHQFDFTHLCTVAWDMLYLKPLDQVFPDLAPDTNYMSLSATYGELLDSGWPWIQGRFKSHIDALLKMFADEGHPVAIETLSFAMMAGSVMCRKFLERFAQRSAPSYSNDEVRMVLFSHVLGIPLLNNGFVTDGNNHLDASVAVGEAGCGEAEVRGVLAKGGKVIHPVRQVIPRFDAIFS